MLPLKCEPHQGDAARSDGGNERQPVTEHRDRRDLFAKCYDFLRAYVEGNKANQELAFVHLNHFIDTMGIAGINVADFLRSMLNNIVLLNKIPTEFPRKILELLQIYGKKARWLRLLSVLAVCNKKAIKRNQQLIMGMIDEFQDVVGDFAFDVIYRIMSQSY